MPGAESTPVVKTQRKLLGIGESGTVIGKPKLCPKEIVPVDRTVNLNDIVVCKYCEAKLRVHYTLAIGQVSTPPGSIWCPVCYKPFPAPSKIQGTVAKVELTEPAGNKCRQITL
jgi:hypothetical protein